MRITKVSAALTAIALVAGAASAFAELQIEHATVATIKPDNGHRLYIADMFPPAHAVDSKIRIIDGDDFSVLGQVTNGSFGNFAISADRKQIIDATSFFSRGDHGVRTDVVEYYDTSTLNPTSETILPGKRAMTIGYPVFLVETFGSKYLLLQNATPASSISVIDFTTKTVLSEIPTAGCFGIYASPTTAGRFSTLCGDGAAVTVNFDEKGAETSRKRSEKLFDPDTDALFIAGVSTGAKTIFVSFPGNVHIIDFSGETASQEAPWSLLSAKDKAGNWRPGGYGNIAYSQDTKQLYVGMHPNGEEGSHKTPAAEIWKVDIAKKTVALRAKSDGATYMQVSKEAHPLLFTVNGRLGSITKYDGDTLKALGSSKKDLLEGGGPIWVE